MKNAAALIGSLLLLSACGGGGDSGSPTPPPPPSTPPAPVISYAPASHEFTTEVAIATLSPTVTGGTPTQYSVAPALPAGLTLNTTNGQISGTPSQAAAAATFVVTGSNSGGSSSFNLSIAVNSGQLLDLGHSWDIIAIRYDSGRILSRDRRGGWVLWNSATGERLAGGFTGCPIDCNKSIALAGTTAVIEGASGIEVRSATDGTALWTAPLSPGHWWSLATDGSYVATGEATGLTVRSRAGTQLFAEAGNFPGPGFATPTELRVARSPAGSSVIRTYAIPAGTASNGPGFQGEFHSWFLDGSRFFTRLNTSYWVYSSDGEQQGAGTFASDVDLGGRGDRIWRRETTSLSPSITTDLVVYAFGPGFDELVRFPLPHLANDIVPSGNTLGVLVASNTLHGIVDLAPATPTWTDFNTQVSNVAAFAALSTTDRVFGNADGVVMRSVVGSPTQLYSLGRVRGIAGSTTRFALAFSAGNINYYDAATGSLEGVIEVPPPRKAAFYQPVAMRLQLSRDGNTLAVGAVDDDGASSYVTLYSLPSEDVIGNFVFHAPDNLTNYSLSGSGGVLSFVTGPAPGSIPSGASLVHADGTPIWSQAQHAGSAPLLTHSGAAAAFALAPVTATSASRVIENGTLTGTLDGVFVNWLDEQRAITNRFTMDSFGFLVYDGARIVDRSGTVLASPALPRVDSFDVAGTDRIYVPGLNAILDATNGNPVWDSASSDPVAGARIGTVAGDHVVFGTYSQVRREPYQ